MERRSMTTSSRLELVKTRQKTNRNAETSSSGVQPGVEVEAQRRNIDFKGPYPGGPVDRSVLPSYRTHVALDVWENIEQPLLRCIEHIDKLRDWNIEDAPLCVKQRIKHSGLYNASLTRYNTNNRALISAFVERWYPKTNTIHVPFGEMTITLDDVHQLIRIPVTGLPIIPREPTLEELVVLCTTCLGVVEEAVIEEMCSDDCKKRFVRLKWLRENCSDCPPDPTREKAGFMARGYLLYLLGCTIFVDRSSILVQVKFLMLLEDIGNVHTYAWGAVALSYLYHELGVASRGGVRQILGYLTLLQAWWFEHFPFEHQMLNPNYNLVTYPLALRWAFHLTQTLNVNARKLELREFLDHLTSDPVIWDPNQANSDDILRCPLNVFYRGFLFSPDCCEPYHPDRILHQFGHVLSIPPLPIQPTSKMARGYIAKAYNVYYDVAPEQWNTWKNHQLIGAERGEIIVDPWDCVDGYLHLYERITQICYKPQSTASTPEVLP